MWVLREFSWTKISALGLAVTAHLVAGFILIHGKGIDGEGLLRTFSPTIEISFIGPGGSTSQGVQSGTDILEFPSEVIVGQTATKLPVADSTAGLPIYKANESRYFRSSELTEKPLVLEDIPPDLGGMLPDVPPQSATIRLLISEAGSVDRVLFDSSTLPNFAEILIRDVFSKIRFLPGKIDGSSVKSELKIEVLIEPDLTHNTVAHGN